MKKIQIGGVTIGDPKRFAVIAGPCVIESERAAFFHARKLREITGELGIPFVFKASYDKANRSSIDSYRGPGLEKGLEILSNIREKLSVPVLSDVHTPEEAASAGEVLDIVQIPAFLSRQTDLLVEAGRTKKVVNIKKGQFLSPHDMEHVVAKVRSTGNNRILLTERGAMFGYNRLVVDFPSLQIMRSFGVPVVMDVTHAVQIPGGQGSKSGGNRQFIPTIARCGVVSGADALFFEVHRNPDEALSDGPNSYKLSKFKSLLAQLVRVKQAVVGG